LDHRAHCTVNDDDALVQQLFKLSFDARMLAHYFISYGYAKHRSSLSK
jgi:hypothetical protein